jgi:hypothetical protein
VTALIAWVGYDSRRAASLNIASDSRISFGSVPWDVGRKIFALRGRPEIFGYCGDVIFPSQVLGQLSSMLERDLLVSDVSTVDQRAGAIRDFLELSVKQYPASEARAFSIVYARRDGLGRAARFHLYQLDWNDQRQLTFQPIPLPAAGEIHAVGSGKAYVLECFKDWMRSDVRNTSRASFCALVDAIRSGKDRGTGGAPQLASLMNGLVDPKEIGIIWGGSRFLNGAEVRASEALRNTWWRNELFEICDGFTGLRNSDAQPQPRPAQRLEPNIDRLG